MLKLVMVVVRSTTTVRYCQA